MTNFLPALFIWLAAISLLIAICCVWLSLRALLGGETMRWVEQSQAAQRRAEWLEEKEAVLRSLKDLEFERDVGKLSGDDFDRLHAQFRARAKQIMRQLDDDLAQHRDQARALIAQAKLSAPKLATPELSTQEKSP